jgi:formyltetrahydrofolate deformylase
MNVPENEPKEPRSVTLLLHCPLRLGLAAGLTQFIYTHGGRILYHEQYVDTDGSITKENKSEVEDEQMALLQSHRIDVVVLARYMQILTGRFVEAYLSRMINIHHAFLPAFPGARPYYSARERGVKMIGATSHYVTETLDAGPIIEQDVLHVTHRHSVQDLIRSGRDLEKVVLSRAIRSHIEWKIIVHKGRTVVFH